MVVCGAVYSFVARAAHQERAGAAIRRECGVVSTKVRSFLSCPIRFFVSLRASMAWFSVGLALSSAFVADSVPESHAVRTAEDAKAAERGRGALLRLAAAERG